MFTGIVEGMAQVLSFEPQGDVSRLSLEAGPLAAGAALGDSISVSGACLSVVQHDGSRLGFDLVPETLAVTTLSRLRPGDRVNLERALRAGDRLGGHWVMGHVDGVAEVRALVRQVESAEMRLRLPAQLMRYVIAKGSITVDGVSLTVAGLDGQDGVRIALIPHTLAHTTLGALEPGAAVNIEVDVLAKYIERLQLPLAESAP